MRKVLQVGGLLVLILAAGGTAFWYQSHRKPSYVPYDAELEYLKVLNDSGSAKDPRTVLLLMAEFINAKRTQEGISKFESYLQEYKLSNAQKAIYLCALGLLRAVHTEDIFPLRQPGWVRETIRILEEARTLSGNDEFVIRWTTGIVYSRLPGFFGKRDQAREDLEWCIRNISKAIDIGWIREAQFHLALVYHKNGEESQAQEYLALSGYKDFQKQIILTTNFSAELKKGHTAGVPKLIESIPGKIFTLSGFEFSDFNFVISDDGKELIGIDTGTTPQTARQAFQVLKEKMPNLPPLTTVFITHSHWDHLGGYHFYRELNPDAVFYARENYRHELDIVLKTPLTFPYFLGTGFHLDLISDFRPGVTVAEHTTLQVGETTIELFPVHGGETEDALFIYLPQHSVLYIGDFLMPYFGGPFKEEGNIPGLFEAIDLVAKLNPSILIHGHEPLTRILDTPATLVRLKQHLQWLRNETLRLTHTGTVGRADLHRLNLIPPAFHETAEIQIAYLAMRENFINRIYDQDQGYWQLGDLNGIDALGDQEYGALLTQYFRLSENQIASAIQKMIQNGDYALARHTLNWAFTQYPDSPPLNSLKKQVYLKLKEKFQAISPFKFIVYSEMVEDETPQLKLQTEMSEN